MKLILADGLVPNEKELRAAAKQAGLGFNDEKGEIMSSAESLKKAENRPEAARKGMTPEMEATLSCMICLQIVVKPVIRVGECECVTTVCRGCMSKALKYSKVCPTCRCSVKSINSNGALEATICGLSYKCWHCQKEGLVMENLEKHLDTHKDADAISASNTIHIIKYRPLIDDLQRTYQALQQEKRARADEANVVDACRLKVSEHQKTIASIRSLTDKAGAFSITPAVGNDTLRRGLASDPIEEGSPRRSRSPVPRREISHQTNLLIEQAARRMAEVHQARSIFNERTVRSRGQR